MKNHSSKKNIIGVISSLLLFSFTTAHAVVNLSVNIVPILESGDDPHGLASSTWTMSFDLPDNYGNAIPRAVAVLEGTLNVSGSVDVDGSYTIISDRGDFSGFEFQPYRPIGGDPLLFFGFDLGGSTPNQFDFAGLTVSNFIGQGTSLITEIPPGGSPVLASQWNGAIISSSSFFPNMTISDGIDSGQFSFSNALITATDSVIPEPSHVAFLTASLVLFSLTIYCRRRRKTDPIFRM